MTEEEKKTNHTRLESRIMMLDFLFLKSLFLDDSVFGSSIKEIIESFLEELKSETTEEEKDIIRAESTILANFVVSHLTVLACFKSKIKDPSLYDEYTRILTPVVLRFSQTNNFLKRVFDVIPHLQDQTTTTN